ncbi:MAG: DUF6338 family protein [Gammaproteobacteria bacterium]
MLSTAVSIFAAVAVLMPGFIVAELSLARSARSSRSDLELGLRAIAYALVVHLAFGFWTVWLVDRVGSVDDLPDHLGAVSLYVGVVLLAVPALLGSLLNVFLAQAEVGDGPPGRLAASFGAGEARDAFDYAFQQRRERGSWVIIELVGHTPEAPRLVGGIYGRQSAIGQTPASHDVYLEALCTVAEDGSGVRRLDKRLQPARGVYLAAAQIARIELLADADRHPAG